METAAEQKPENQEKESEVELLDFSTIVTKTNIFFTQKWHTLFLWAFILVWGFQAIQDVTKFMYESDNFVLYIAAVAAGLVVMNALSAAYMRMILRHARGKFITMREAIENTFPILVPYIIASTMFGIASLVGFVLFVVPAIILMLIFGFGPVIVIEGKRNVIGAFKESMEITRGRRLRLFGVYFPMFLLVFFCLVPWFVLPGVIANAIFIIIFSFVYMYMSMFSATTYYFLKDTRG